MGVYFLNLVFAKILEGGIGVIFSPVEGIRNILAGGSIVQTQSGNPANDSLNLCGYQFLHQY